MHVVEQNSTRFQRYLHTIFALIEHPSPPYMAQDLVLGVVHDVVRDHRRQSRFLQQQYTHASHQYTHSKRWQHHASSQTQDTARPREQYTVGASTDRIVLFLKRRLTSPRLMQCLILTISSRLSRSSTFGMTPLLIQQPTVLILKRHTRRCRQRQTYGKQQKSKLVRNT